MIEREEQHEGEIIKKAIKEVKLPLSVIARRMRISRSTLYTRFKDKKLKDFFILKLGYILGGYDFSVLLPRLEKAKEVFYKTEELEFIHSRNKYLGTLKNIQKKYYNLLEMHRKAILSLARVRAELPQGSSLSNDIDHLFPRNVCGRKEGQCRGREEQHEGEIVKKQ